MIDSKTIDNAKRYVNKLLVPLEKHYYHSYEHALDVMDRAMYLGKKEGLSFDDIEILGIAGLFHDTGFVIQYDQNEAIGAKITQNYLKSIVYPRDKIEKIEALIMATIPEYKTPKNILEKIIKDADMDNLGRNDFFEKAYSLKKEIEIIKNIKIKDPEWVHGSIELLKEYHYQTKTQKNERDSTKEKNLKCMMKELEESNI